MSRACSRHRGICFEILSLGFAIKSTWQHFLPRILLRLRGRAGHKVQGAAACRVAVTLSCSGPAQRQPPLAHLAPGQSRIPKRGICCLQKSQTFTGPGPACPYVDQALDVGHLGGARSWVREPESAESLSRGQQAAGADSTPRAQGGGAFLLPGALGGITPSPPPRFCWSGSSAPQAGTSHWTFSTVQQTGDSESRTDGALLWPGWEGGRCFSHRAALGSRGRKKG